MGDVFGFYVLSYWQKKKRQRKILENNSWYFHNLTYLGERVSEFEV